MVERYFVSVSSIGKYLTGKKVADDFLENMPVYWNTFLPKWNYSFANTNK
jgi:hypothetical protein